ncbi:MAG: 30S ribosomal protein S8 [Candidatus Pacearchaeota archaeon]
MAQDIISDALNMIMNEKRVGKKEVVIKRISKFLIAILEKMKKEDYLDFEVIKEKGNKSSVKVTIKEKLNECKAIKPRFSVTVKEIEKYQRRYLPSRNFGKILISTSKGLMDHHEALNKNIGGCLVAYYY